MPALLKTWWSILPLLLLNSVHAENSTNITSICTHENVLHPLLKPSPLPMCSLSAPSNDPAPEFLSFEDWKAKQLAEQQKEVHASRDKEGHSSAATSSTEAHPEHERRNASTTIDEDPMLHPRAIEEQIAQNTPETSPRSHIPLIDRFNYASDECNARIQSSHKSAKSASSILSRKKDRYMLSPCQTTQGQYVIVELCEDIRIDTVQLANFEFFSGVFKDFRVSVAHTYTSDGQGWVTVGEYRAKNIRGVQSFHPVKELSPFYRYIRIDFLSYYGTEYFCPVSLLRVYGLTQMEEWKSDVWKEEWEASQKVTVSSIESETSGSSGSSKSVEVPSSDPSIITAQETVLRHSIENLNDSSITSIGQDFIIISPDEGSPIKSKLLRRKHQSTSMIAASTSTPLHAETQATINETASATSTPIAESSGTAEPSSTQKEDASTHVTSSPITGSAEHRPTVTTTVSTTIVLSAATPSASILGAGESVYRMIINRLNSLEGNHTLYARYVEEQARTVNARLERFEEDIGRIGGLATSHQQVVARMIERHREEMDIKHDHIVTQIQLLSHEVLIEKRLGVAQLILLSTVLVFMGLTRGSRGDNLRVSRHAAVTLGGRASAAWNRGIRRSGDWVTGWRSPAMKSEDNLVLPSTPLRSAFAPQSTNQQNHSSKGNRRSSSQGPRMMDDPFSTPGKRSRTSSGPQFLQTPRKNRTSTSSTGKADSASPSVPPFRPITPGTLLPKTPRQNANLGARSISLSTGRTVGAVGGPHGSVRKLAKTAHMHEVKSAIKRNKLQSDNSLESSTPLTQSIVTNKHSDFAAMLDGIPFPSPILDDDGDPEAEDAWLDESDYDNSQRERIPSGTSFRFRSANHPISFPSSDEQPDFGLEISIDENPSVDVG